MTVGYWFGLKRPNWNIPSTRPQKGSIPITKSIIWYLQKRYYGPFQILFQINEMAYRLKFLANWHIHNAFHVSLLKPFKGNPPKETMQEEPPLFDKLDCNHHKRSWDMKKVHYIVVKVICKYLVKFKHYPNKDSKRIQEAQLKDALSLLQSYKTLHKLI